MYASGFSEKTYIARGGTTLDLSEKEIDELFSEALSKALSDINNAGPVIIVPPDSTRIHSRAGYITGIAARELGRSSKDRLGAVLPALGTHAPITAADRERMFPGIPKEKFLVHNWRNDVCCLGSLPAGWVSAALEGAVNFDWPVEANKLLRKDGAFSLILSVGQVVPHEVTGMANHTKNIFIGTGGKEAIDKSHFAGAAYGMERLMGRMNNPVRSLLDEGFRRFGSELPPILWVLTVVGERTNEEAAAVSSGTADPSNAAPVSDEAAKKRKNPFAVRGLFIGFGRECFEKAAELSSKVNVNILAEPVQKAIAFLAPEEFRTTWLGNKAIYRTRMAIANRGELVIIAPGLERFGEDRDIDTLIRKHGYRNKAEIFDRITADPELGDNLCAAAHLIHGSSEGRFTIRYCPGPNLSRKEIESVGYEWGDLKETAAHYNINALCPGWNTADGERIFFVPNPALGLWCAKS